MSIERKTLEGDWAECMACGVTQPKRDLVEAGSRWACKDPKRCAHLRAEKARPPAPEPVGRAEDHVRELHDVCAVQDVDGRPCASWPNHDGDHRHPEGWVAQCACGAYWDEDCHCPPAEEVAASEPSPYALNGAALRVLVG